MKNRLNSRIKIYLMTVLSKIIAQGESLKLIIKFKNISNSKEKEQVKISIQPLTILIKA